MIIVKQVQFLKRSLETLSLFTSLTWVSTKPKGAIKCFCTREQKTKCFTGSFKPLIFQHPINITNKVEGCRIPTMDTNNYLELPSHKELEFFFLLKPSIPSSSYPQESLALLASWLFEKKRELQRRTCCFRAVIIRNIFFLVSWRMY